MQFFNHWDPTEEDTLYRLSFLHGKHMKVWKAFLSLAGGKEGQGMLLLALTIFEDGIL